MGGPSLPVLQQALDAIKALGDELVLTDRPFRTRGRVEDKRLEAEKDQPSQWISLGPAVGGGDPNHDAEKDVSHRHPHTRLGQGEARGLARLNPLPRVIDQMEEVDERAVGIVEAAQGSFGERAGAREGRLRFGVSSPGRAIGNNHTPVWIVRPLDTEGRGGSTDGLERTTD